MDASNLLKPVLTSSHLRCIGSTTYQEYRGIFDKDRALSRRFQKIDVDEPDVDTTYKILKGLKSRFEDHHNLRYSDKSLKAASELADRYINDRYMPDKAIDVIDEAGAYQRLQPPSKRKKLIQVGDMERVVAAIARIPPKHVSSSDLDALKNLESNLKMVVFGQNRAIDSLATAIKLSRAGLNDAEKPIGSFLFSGPTGVGKTELARALAEFLFADRDALIRVDMSEYMEKFSVSRLIGAPPGYVGYEDSGALTKAVRRRPYSVVLLDEIEKAHPDVFNILLQVLDEGHLTDNYGRVIDFKNTVLIMTSNLGAREIAKGGGLGFQSADPTKSYDVMQDKVRQEIERAFNPEFLNRVDDTIVFHPLSKDEIAEIVHILLAEMRERLSEEDMTLTITDAAVELLVDEGYDEKFGARPLKRAIQKFLEDPLSEKILTAEFTAGDEIEVDADPDGGSLTLRVESTTKT